MKYSLQEIAELMENEFTCVSSRIYVGKYK